MVIILFPSIHHTSYQFLLIPNWLTVGRQSRWYFQLWDIFLITRTCQLRTTIDIRTILLVSVTWRISNTYTANRMHSWIVITHDCSILIASTDNRCKLKLMISYYCRANVNCVYCYQLVTPLSCSTSTLST
jgi:hypothetical protein